MVGISYLGCDRMGSGIGTRLDRSQHGRSGLSAQFSSVAIGMGVWVVALSVLVSGAEAQDWPALRGAEGVELVTRDGILKQNSDVELKVRWKRQLGSGYSSVVIVGDRLVTLYSDEDKDFVGCFDVQTGDTIWQFSMGPRFIGENGSFDGPISTPLIDNGYVCALSGSGDLFCLKLEDGSLVWTIDLEDGEGAVRPLYGFATSPMMAGGNLVVQFGAKEKALVGLDLPTGTIKWSVGTDAIDSQTPTRMMLDGREILLAVGRQNLLVVDPSDGRLLCEYAHENNFGDSVVPAPIGERKVLFTNGKQNAKAVDLARSGNEVTVSDAWQERAIKNSYNVPVFAAGNVFAYSTRILTCVDPENGRALWKARQPGDGFLIAVDGHLIISTKRGSLHLATASADGYQEVANIELFGDLVWSIPAYCGNAIFQRSLNELACVDIVAKSGTELATEASELPMSAQFAMFIDDVTSAVGEERKMKRVTQFMETQTAFPVVEGSFAHFLYRGDAKDVALACDVFGARQEQKMMHLPGTDLFYYSMKLPNNQRANYMFLVDYQPTLDPLNARVVTSNLYAGEMEFATPRDAPLKLSWFAMGQWREPTYFHGLRESLAGKLETHSIESEGFDSAIEFDVYTPPNYDAQGTQRFPVAYIFDGKTVQAKGHFATLADNLYRQAIESGSKDVQPAVLVFISTRGRGRPFYDAIALDLVSFIDKQYQTVSDREQRSCIAFGETAPMALQAATGHPETFSCVNIQTPMIFAGLPQLFARLKEIEQPMRFYIEWGRFDLHNPDENWDIRQTGQEIFDAIKKNPHFEIRGGRVNDSTDWSSWKNRYDRVLQFSETTE